MHSTFLFQPIYFLTNPETKHTNFGKWFCWEEELCYLACAEKKWRYVYISLEFLKLIFFSSISTLLAGEDFFFFFNIYSKNWINVFVTSPSISLLSDLVQGMDRLRRCKISGLLVEIDPDFHSCTVFLQGVPACTV